MRALACLIFTGCMTDPTGSTCLPLPGGDGFCGGGGGGGTQHFKGFMSPSIAVDPQLARGATERTDDLRIAFHAFQTDGPGESDLTAVEGDRASDRKRLAIGDDAIMPQLGHIDDQWLLAWNDLPSTSGHAAVLAADGTLDPATRVDLDARVIALHRVGSRLLALHHVDAHGVAGTWLRADGTVDGTVSFTGEATDLFVDVAGDPQGVGVWAHAFVGTHDGQSELYVTRIGADGHVIDEAKLIASGQYLGAPSLTVLPDGGVLVLYRANDGMHAARIAPTGVVTDIATALKPAFHTVLRDDRILVLSFDVDASVDVDGAYDLSSRLIDLDGRVVAGPFPMGRSSFSFSAVATPTGYAIANEDIGDDIELLRLGPDGRLLAAPLSIAQAEDGGGCNAGGGTPGLMLVLVLGALYRTRTRR